MPPEKKEVDDILREYGSKIDSQVSTFNARGVGSGDYSQSYVKFKDEMAPETSRYEKWCKSLGNLIKLKVSEKDEAKIRRQLEIAHLDLEAWQP